ncbi:hypothetical protein C5Y93_10970 [Blastopirellula marina]|uniref:RND efflux pump membrane fusion protein barrel-sandwich domain-containing protein n=2 Tax=Blastopirellula marina TaxID=124 RepID=A0A2S8GNT4_9BACT|nr:hypothetical protein C5Y93_10970 [Blastopirellula marina]
MTHNIKDRPRRLTFAKLTPCLPRNSENRSRKPRMTTPTSESRPGIGSTIAKVLPSILVIGALTGVWFSVHHMGSSTHEETAEGEHEPTEEVTADVLTLPPGKVSAAELVINPIGTQTIQHTHVVPGRIAYDETRHVEVRSPIEGILQSVNVKPGDRVVHGQLLAVVTSPEFGKARAELMRCEAECKLVASQTERTQEIAANLRLYAKLLAEDVDSEEIETQLKDRSLGSYRTQLQPAHSKLSLSRDLLANIQPLSGTGAIAGRTVRERESQFEVARAEFQAVLDQAIFDAKQSEQQAAADLADAQRQVDIAQEKLTALIGNGEEFSPEKLGERISELEIRATMDGTIEARHFAPNERVYQADSLFTLADTSSLYVKADVREGDWPAVNVEPGTEVRLDMPALQERTFHAHVNYVGREVSADTNSVPVVASVANPEGLLRPGMFARVTLPIGPPRKALAVNAESIVHHDNREFVFVQTGDYEFHCVPVETGLVSEEWIEIVSGLQGSEQVVQKGAFLLKSEWLLEGEAE